MKAMILAAGFGTRLKPYSEHTPKPLFTINQRPVLDITIKKLCQTGCNAIIINTHQHHTQIEAFVGSRSYPVPVHLRYEPQILGTGGALRNVADLWNHEPLLVINGDVVCDIDLREVYNAHQRHDGCVTMVMHDHPDFNSVGVDEKDCVSGFGKNADINTRDKCLAFTGIHILDQVVLDYLPAQGPAHIIDAYTQMLAAGKRIKAHRVQKHYWQDIGTPARYQTAVYDHMAQAAFDEAFGTASQRPIQRDHLSGDGSDRQWYRLSSGSRSLIMADHGICRDPGIPQEVDAYVNIGNHLHARKASVPRIYLWDKFAGLVFMEDMGDRHLAQDVRNRPLQKQLDLYKKVIDAWLHMAMAGHHDFNPNWSHQSASYDVPTILEHECRYFVKAFLQDYLGWSLPYEALAEEFQRLAEATVESGVYGLMHRDLQSRNIMVRKDSISFIDFQGARPGPLQYDLASLLIDPYVALAPELQSQLLTYCANRLEHIHGIAQKDFISGFGHCVLTRNLQMLGAFAYLSSVKKKTQFERYIPLAIDNLHRHVAGFEPLELPELSETAAKAAQEITRREQSIASKKYK